MSQDVKKCPFCGSEGDYDFEEHVAGDGVYVAHCSNEECPAGSPDFWMTTEAWNERASSWISVAEKMPEVNSRAFVYSTFYRDVFVAYVDTDGFWADVADDETIESVTHWMPLPVPPNEATS